MILDPHPDPDQHQNLTTCRGSLLAHGYHVWLTLQVNSQWQCALMRHR